ncbi:MAG TPA: carboxypeptidase-like regulatory domain-containing protein [Terriglobales bacterium]|nr:carboxypeptidase-like regulatory domain-containing protein [Terriglobales bacterium]
MLRKLGCLFVTLGLALPVWAAQQPGSISGYVHNATGIPQMGAMVEVFGAAFHTLQLFTDETGFYNVGGLVPGVYRVRVSAPTFMPALRERVPVRAGGHAVVNLTLSTLFDFISVAPARGGSDEDNWKWVLRSASNRPILRALEENRPAGEKSKDSDLRGTLSFFAGSPSAGFGSSSDATTSFRMEKSIFSSGTVALSGDVGYGSGIPAAVLRASYASHLVDGSGPEMAITVRNLASPAGSLPNADLQALSLTAADNLNLGDVLELRFGSELQTIQFMGRVTAMQPFGMADLHLSPNTVVEYRYTSSEPDRRIEKGFDSAPADFSESGPHVSLAGFRPAIERSHHQEVSLSRRIGKNSVQLAAYYDRVIDPALTGVGEASVEGGDVLPDLYSGTFTYQGKDLNTHGVRIVAQRKLTPNLTATMDYEFGGALDLEKQGADLQDARNWMEVKNRHSMAGKISGTLPRAKTFWITSYRWTDGQPLTPVDMFDESPGQADPYLSFFLRQPIPGTGFFPGHVDALIDVRNLLAQGYVPVLGQDHRTVYLVQSARAVRGGVEFTF